MSDTVTYYKGAMTLEDFREIVRSLQARKPESVDPFEQLRNNPLFDRRLQESMMDFVMEN